MDKVTKSSSIGTQPPGVRIDIEDIAFGGDRQSFSPRDQSPEAEEYFRQYRQRFPGRGSGSWSTGR